MLRILIEIFFKGPPYQKMEVPLRAASIKPLKSKHLSIYSQKWTDNPLADQDAGDEHDQFIVEIIMGISSGKIEKTSQCLAKKDGVFLKNDLYLIRFALNQFAGFLERKNAKRQGRHGSLIFVQDCFEKIVLSKTAHTPSNLPVL